MTFEISIFGFEEDTFLTSIFGSLEMFANSALLEAQIVVVWLRSRYSGDGVVETKVKAKPAASEMKTERGKRSREKGICTKKEGLVWIE